MRERELLRELHEAYVWKVNAAVEEGRMDLVWDFADEYTDEALRLMTTLESPACGRPDCAVCAAPAPDRACLRAAGGCGGGAMAGCPRTVGHGRASPVPRPRVRWTGTLSLSKQHDQGVVVLNAPATSKWPGITPAPLLPLGTLDTNQGALKNQTFTLVGYGVDIGAKKAQVVVLETALHHVVPEERAGRGRHLPDQRPRLEGGRRILLR